MWSSMAEQTEAAYGREGPKVSGFQYRSVLLITGATEALKHLAAAVEMLARALFGLVVKDANASPVENLNEAFRQLLGFFLTCVMQVQATYQHWVAEDHDNPVLGRGLHITGIAKDLAKRVRAFEDS